MEGGVFFVVGQRLASSGHLTFFVNIVATLGTRECRVMTVGAGSLHKPHHKAGLPDRPLQSLLVVLGVPSDAQVRSLPSEWADGRLVPRPTDPRVGPAPRAHEVEDGAYLGHPEEISGA